MVTRKGIDFFPLSRSRWTKLSFPACGAARQALNLSASFLCLSQLDIKPQGLWCGCCCPPGDFLAVLRKVTLLFWRPQGTREPVLSDTFSGLNTPMSPAQSGMAVGQERVWAAGSGAGPELAACSHHQGHPSVAACGRDTQTHLA